MPMVTISLPDEIKTLAVAEAVRSGKTLEEYLTSLILAVVEQPVGEKMETELLKGLESPGREFSTTAWEAKKSRFDERQALGE